MALAHWTLNTLCHMVVSGQNYTWCLIIKASSLFATWLSELVIINHIIWSNGHSKSSMITISPNCLYEKKNFLGSLCALLEYFRENKLPSDRRSHWGQERFTELFLSNIMKHDKNDIEWQTSIQGMSLSDFWDYLRKREGRFKEMFNSLHHNMSNSLHFAIQNYCLIL